MLVKGEIKERNHGKILAAQSVRGNTDMRAMYGRKGVKNLLVHQTISSERGDVSSPSLDLGELQELGQERRPEQVVVHPLTADRDSCRIRIFAGC